VQLFNLGTRLVGILLQSNQKIPESATKIFSFPPFFKLTLLLWVIEQIPSQKSQSFCFNVEERKEAIKIGSLFCKATNNIKRDFPLAFG
jgi:hypothetical protein